MLKIKLKNLKNKPYNKNKQLKIKISETSKISQATVSYDGILEGEEYIKFLFRSFLKNVTPFQV